jgi:hypothetical protein
VANPLAQAQINTIYQNDLGRAASLAEQPAWFAADSAGAQTDAEAIVGIFYVDAHSGSYWGD